MKYLNKRYKGIGTKIYKILIQPAFPNLPNLNQIRYKDYSDGIEKIFQDKPAEDLRQIAFLLFKQPKDINKDPDTSKIVGRGPLSE